MAAVRIQEAASHRLDEIYRYTRDRWGTVAFARISGCEAVGPTRTTSAERATPRGIQSSIVG